MRAYEQRAAAIMKRIKDIPEPIVAEIGVATGNLSGQLLREHPGLKLFMVDNWKEEKDQPEAYRATNDSNSRLTKDKASIHKNRAETVAKRFGRAEIVNMDSVEAAKLFDDETFDLVFIDADHSYEGVKADIEAWYPKVKEGGWICGHDYNNTDPRFRFDVNRAVDEFFNPELDLNFTWFHRK